MLQATDMEQLVHELNDPRNQSSPAVIDEIQKRIQRLQRDSLAWQWAVDLLNHGEAVMRFYGALTLTIKINADWDTDKVGEDRDMINSLLENLVSSYVRLSSIPDVSFVLQKLCTTLVAVFQKPQSAWALPVRHLAACTIAGRYISQSSVPDMNTLFDSNTAISGAQLRSLLMFPMTLAEQDAAVSGSVKEQGVRVRISNNSGDILRLLHFAANSFSISIGSNVAAIPAHYTLRVDYDNAQIIDTANTMLQLIPLWTNDIKIKGSKKDSHTADPKFDLFVATVRTCPQLFQQPDLAPAVLQALTALEESSHRLLQHALPGYQDHIIRSPQAALWVEQLISGDFDPDAMSYVNLLEACIGQVDVTSPDYLATEFYVEILKQIRMLLQCEGAAGVEDTVCQVALEILTSVTEGFSDWPGPSPYDDLMRQLVRAACSSALDKIRIPHDELSTKTQTWDSDDRAKFGYFRYDVQDYLQNAFGILGDSLVEEITKTIIEARLPSQWDLFEASLFGFVAFSDTLANEPERFDKYLAAVFGCEQWHTAVLAETDVPDRVRQGIIKMIGENTGFLQRYTDFLVPTLNFLFASLHIESLVTVASRTIYTLCDSQRSILTGALPEFMNSLDNTSDIEEDAKHRIYSAVGAIIQALPSEDEKVQPLTSIFRRLLRQEVENDVDPATTHSELVTAAVNVLQTVAALGRGLRAPSDIPINLEDTESSQARFWTDGPGSGVQQQILHIHTTLLQNVNGQEDPLFIESACDLLRAGFTEEHPSPFKMSNARNIELIATYLQWQCRQPDQVMSTASSYLASVNPTDPDNEFSTILLMSVHAVNDAYMAHKTTEQPLNSDFCTASLDFYARLLPKWAPSLFSMAESHDIVALILEISLLLIEDTDTFPRRTAAGFFTSFFEASVQPAFNDFSTPATQCLSVILQAFTPRIIASLIHLLGGVCARSDIDAITEPLKKAIQKQPLLTNRLLKEALKDENAVLTQRALAATRPEQRARFASQIEMLRGQRKTNEIMREFWIACKGKEFEYVT